MNLTSVWLILIKKNLIILKNKNKKHFQPEFKKKNPYQMSMKNKKSKTPKN